MGERSTLEPNPAPVVPQVNIAGVEVSAVDMRRTVTFLEEHIRRGRKGYVCVSDVHSLMKASRTHGLLDVFCKAALVLPDGMPLVWAGRRAGAKDMGRVCGPDLLPELLAVGAVHGWKNYFVGGRPEVTALLRKNLEELVPGVQIVGTSCPPFRKLSAEEDAALAADINAARPDIVWVGLGAPKQEYWMAEHRGVLEASLLIGVGAAFDMHAGKIPRAPVWMRRAGLEWLYRLSREPRRLWRRYLVTIPQFVTSVVQQKPHLVRHQ